jgi:hypothetical protein
MPSKGEIWLPGLGTPSRAGTLTLLGINQLIQINHIALIWASRQIQGRGVCLSRWFIKPSYLDQTIFLMP